ncbi:MAG TPA: ABC transporter permease [Gemmataceae bacterium]|nr:ABC transporter permease [Gemmataceae bacterium]
MTQLLSLLPSGILLAFVQVVAALPWLLLVNRATVTSSLRRRSVVEILLTIVGVLAGLAVLGGAFASLLWLVQDKERLEFWGRVYGSVLQAQLTVDFFVVVLAIVLRLWPKGGAVALAAFREALRQPMFWMLVGVAVLLMTVSLFLPYFTFGDDFKMVKQINFDIVMLFAVAFGVIAAALSISEEIEGRTAVTLMSKPVSRRQFLLGKFLGILLASLVMTGILSWLLHWVLFIRPVFDPLENAHDLLQAQIAPNLTRMVQEWIRLGNMFHRAETLAFVNGFALQAADVLAALPGLIIGACQVMVLVAIAAALATRLPMLVNLPTCLLLFFLGNLSPVLVQVSQKLRDQQGGGATMDLINFMARLFDTVLPALEFFNLGPAIIRDIPLDVLSFAKYCGSVCLYALLYTSIAMLFGLILFEDRDLA